MKIKLPHKGGRLSVPAVKVRKNEIPLFHLKADLALGFWVDPDTLLLMSIKKNIKVHYVGLEMLQLPINFHYMQVVRSILSIAALGGQITEALSQG